MNEYFVSAVIITAISGIIGILLPENGKAGNASVGKYVKYCAALVCLVILIKPVTESIKSISGILDNAGFAKWEPITYDGGESGEWIISQSSDNIKLGISNVLESKYNIPADESDITLNLDESDMQNIKIQSITINLTDYSMWQNAREIEEYLGGLLDTKVNVITR